MQMYIFVSFKIKEFKPVLIRLLFTTPVNPENHYSPYQLSNKLHNTLF